VRDSKLRDRLLRDLYIGLAVAFVALRLLQVEPWDQSVDAYAYWTTRDGDFYGGEAGIEGSYLYSPAFAQALTLLTWLPWPIFDALWTVLNIVTLGWLVGLLALPLLLFIPIPFEIVSGNVHLLYAAAIVLGFRWPATWALMFLTKVTPGIGVLWFAVRREWRQLAIALGVTGAIVAVSYVLDPGAWAAWIELLTTTTGAAPETPGPYLPVPLLVRLPIAAAIVVYASWTDRAWLLPVGVTLALPIVWLNSLAILAACVPLWQRSRGSVPAAPAVRALPAAA
jgi:hypothetical protein